MNSSKLQLVSINLKDFRCFNQETIDLDCPIVLVYGSNGTGKTSLLEALYYGCYLRSFRTPISRDLVAIGKDSFFVKLVVRDNTSDQMLDHTIQIGFAQNKRLVKIDNKSTVSYKDLLEHYRVVSLTEDDLTLIQDGPEERRAFMDQALLIDDASFINKMREYKIILEHRNALFHGESVEPESYFIWTKKLWEHTTVVQQIRKQFLAKLEVEVNKMLNRHIDQDITISFTYQAKKNSDLIFEEFVRKNGSLQELMASELYFKRSLFGVHVDDFTITLAGKKSRAYASRGQQKMIVLLIKMAQIKELTLKNGPLIFLLDDFMTDFDAERGKALLQVLFELNCQLIFTSPRRDSALESALVASQIHYKIISI